MKEGPWFRISGLNYKPICREGYLVALAMFVPALPLGFGFLCLSRSNPTLSWICGVAAVLLIFGFQAIAAYMSEGIFGDD